MIKIERPGVGDAARSYDRTVKGLSSHFVWTNRSKESLTLDVKHDAAKEVLARLIGRRMCSCRTSRLARRRASGSARPSCARSIRG